MQNVCSRGEFYAQQRLPLSEILPANNASSAVEMFAMRTAPDYAAPLPVDTHGLERSAELKGFRFESGERLETLTIGYTTHGKLNDARDNAILLMPGTANTRHSADGYIGPGHAFDTANHFIIASDAIVPEPRLGPAKACANIFRATRFATWCMRSTD